MGQSEEGWRDMDAIDDEADEEAGMVQHAPDNVIMTIQLAGATVGQVCESGGAGLGGGLDLGGGSVGVSEAGEDVLAAGLLDGGDGAGTFGGEGDEQGIGSGDVAECAHVFRGWVAHGGGIMSPGKTGFGREERAFDMPSGDDPGQVGMVIL